MYLSTKNNLSSKNKFWKTCLAQRKDKIPYFYFFSLKETTVLLTVIETSSIVLCTFYVGAERAVSITAPDCLLGECSGGGSISHSREGAASKCHWLNLRRHGVCKKRLMEIYGREEEKNTRWHRVGFCYALKWIRANIYFNFIVWSSQNNASLSKRFSEKSVSNCLIRVSRT